MKNLFIISNWMQGTGLSGGDRILIELTKRWHQKINISLFLSKEGDEICRREGLNLPKQKVWVTDIFSGSILIDGVYRTLKGIYNSLYTTINRDDIVLSASDFWPDFAPAFILKLRNPRIKWIASFYLFAPKPWLKNSPYRGTKRFLGLIYWVSQLPIYYIIKKFADLVFVTSEPDVIPFITKERTIEKIVVVRGGVDMTPVKKYFESGEFISIEQRKYDACFVGRFHYQKGVLELIQIWQKVCRKRPQSRLAIIGTGPLGGAIQNKINQLSIQNNIDLLGFMNGTEKFEIFKQSKTIVHPATYDSGGMAPAEAMAWGLPGVGFDLEALKTYYPEGMLKTQCFDLNEFARNILLLLSDRNAYETLSQKATRLIRDQWDWEKRAEEIFKCIAKSNMS
jgi:glycosyltransferase involved in cell wall biosynthesis